MTDPEQTKALTEGIMRVIDHFGEEFDLTIASTIGVLEIIKFDLIQRTLERGDDE